MNQPPHLVVTRLGLLLALSGLLTLPLTAQNGPQPVPVGKGSYAEYPPNPDAKLQEFLKANLHVDPSVKGRPLPSNDWWTDLLHSGFGGNLWAYPLVVRPVDRGVEIYYPTTWEGNGHDMDKGTPLTVSGVVKPVAQNTSTLIADFEGEQFPTGWHTSGTAFGDGPSAGAVPGETRVTGYMGNRLANSHHGGDNQTGTLTSPSFTLDKPYIHFMIAGGRQPDALYVSLEVDGKTVRKETGENSEQLKWRTWDVSEFAGKQGTIVIVDKATGGWGHVLCDQIIASTESTPPRIGAANAFTPTDAVAADWGDWTLKMRLKQDDSRVMDVTFGRGLPYTWFELTGIDPQLETAPDAAVLNDQGQPLTLPATAGHIIIKQTDHLFAAFAPEGTTWKSDGGKIVALGSAGSIPYLVVAALPDISQIGLFAQHAFALPRQSRFDWTYDPAQGRVATTWKLETQALQGADLDTIQGWLPHQYRETIQNLTFVAPEYATPRGKLRCTVGHDFAIAWPFGGLPPMPPAPKVIAGAPHPFQPDRMKGYFADYIADKMSKPENKRYGGDTYWGGKDLVQYALYAAMAHEMGDDADFKQLQDLSRNALIDWYTYTPGEQEHYFARYENWKAMVGFKTSYGSETFTDNHFHYGYFTLATALTGLNDPQFLQDYGPMATLVAKQYANWDRNDTRFPYLRTFEPFVGHSYAGGSSSGNGNNQESSSEAMQSWTGLFLLGVVLKDKDMTAAGAMGWAIEESAIREYWNDYHGWKDGPAQANFPPSYGHTIAGIVGDSGMSYGTFFNGEPRFIYGIQWLPISTGLYYLGRDPVFNQYQFDSMMKDQAAKKPGFTLSSLGADWGDVTLGYRQFGDPEAVAAQFDELWDANDEIARSKNIAGLTYYFTHADRQLGPVAWDCHTDLPSSLVFRKAGEDHYTVVAWTPNDTPVTCKVFQGDKEIGTVSVPGHTLAALPVPAPK